MAGKLRYAQIYNLIMNTDITQGNKEVMIIFESKNPVPCIKNLISWFSTDCSISFSTEIFTKEIEVREASLKEETKDK